MPARELVFARVAMLLGETAPPCMVVDVPQDVIDVSPQLQVAGRAPHAGPAFGSLWIEDTFDSKMGRGATLPLQCPDAARVLVFHTWCSSRNWDPACLLQSSSGRMWSVDHAWFAPRDFLAAPPDPPEAYISVPGGLTEQSLAAAATPCLAAVIDRLSSLTSDELVATAGGVPPEWPCSSDDRAAIVSYLLGRQQLPRALFAPMLGGS